MGYHYSQFVTFGLFCVFYGHKRQVLSQYLNSKDVIEFILKNLPLVFCLVLTQSSCCLLQGMVKALGMQGSASIYTFVGYYLIGLPLAYIMAYRSPYPEIQGFTGMYLGFIAGIIFVNMSLVRLIYC